LLSGMMTAGGSPVGTGVDVSSEACDRADRRARLQHGRCGASLAVRWGRSARPLETRARRQAMNNSWQRELTRLGGTRATMGGQRLIEIEVGLVNVPEFAGLVLLNSELADCYQRIAHDEQDLGTRQTAEALASWRRVRARGFRERWAEAERVEAAHESRARSAHPRWIVRHSRVTSSPPRAVPRNAAQDRRPMDRSTELARGNGCAPRGRHGGAPDDRVPI
jgi:hypothetical protein